MNKKISQDTVEPNTAKNKTDYNASDVFVFQTDNLGVIRSVEGLASKSLDMGEFIGLSVFDVFKEYSGITDSIRMGLSGKSIRKPLEYNSYKFDAVFTPIKGLNGDLSGVICVAMDITESKNTHEALALSEAKYRMLVENTNDIMFVLNNNAIFTYISSSVKRFGYEVEEIIGKCVFDFIHVEDKAFTIEEIKKSLIGITGNVPRTFRIMIKNGSYIMVEETGTLVRDESGNITHITGILRDVTERTHAEEQLRKSEERYRLLVELMPESVVILQDSTIVFANSGFMQLCSLENQKETIGKCMFNFIHPDCIDISRNISENIFNKKLKSMIYESRIITSENKLVDVEITGSYFIYSDIPSILFIIRDISERKKNKVLIEKIEQNNLLLREAQEYDKLKTEFFSNMSHEFKTPLSVILLTLQLLNLLLGKNSDISHKFNRYFYIMKQNCYRLIRLVNNIIDITRIDSNYYEIKLQNKNIVDIIEDIVLSITDYVENKGLSIQFIKDENEIVCACDPDKIERIMLNLISNAIKFTPSCGKITVRLKKKKRYVLISVIDTGIGIPPDKLDLIFERFRQVDKSLTRNREGSGIGLSLVKSLLEMHGGSISVKSEIGEGSEFMINIPIRFVTSKEDYFPNNDERIKEMQIDRINIEFSDIYSK